MGLSLTSKTHPYKAGFQPFASEIYRIPYATCHQCSYGKQYPSCGAFCAHVLEDTFKRTVAAETVACLIVEPILGEGGFHVPPIAFFTVLQRICRDHGILVIADEIQTGFARSSLRHRPYAGASKLQTPNSKLQTPNSKLQTPNSKLLLMPLVITDAQFDEALQILEAALPGSPVEVPEKLLTVVPAES